MVTHSLECFLEQITLKKKRSVSEIFWLQVSVKKHQEVHFGKCDRNKTQNAPITNRRKYKKNACEHVTVSFGFSSDWLRKKRELFYQIKERMAKQNESKHITFDSQLKTALLREKQIPRQSYGVGRYTQLLSIFVCICNLCNLSMLPE